MGSLAYTIATFEDTVREIKAPPLGGGGINKTIFIIASGVPLKKSE